MNARSYRGFTLMEFVVAIVFIGVVLGPFLLFVSRIHDLRSAIGQQARRESARSLADQALLLGIDPTLAAGLAPDRNPAIPAAPVISITSDPVETVPGLASIVPLHAIRTCDIAEARIPGAGFQIGPGAIVLPRTAPTSPLTPITLPNPLISPADGSIIAATSLAPATGNQPYVADVTAVSPIGTVVTLVFNQPYAMVKGLGTAQTKVNAADLMSGVDGWAWTEYAGNTDQGDRPMVLGDGRTRWFVTRTDHRLQIYEPSAGSHFRYRIGLGGPVVVRGALETDSGATLSFDYAEYQEIQTGRCGLKLDFPAAVKLAFGSSWDTKSIGFQWMFGSAPGPFSGNMTTFFQTDTLAQWADTIAISATPVTPRGAVAQNGAWIFSRVKTALGAPLLSTEADGQGFFTPGQLQFAAPLAANGVSIGRLSFDNGAIVSTGSTLAISVNP